MKKTCSPAPSADAADASPGPKIKKSRASRWRVIVLATVHVLIAIHLAHWMFAETTLSPVEPSESMFFLERGELNAGAILFAAAILSTLLFGRFFCGWACHVVALQDICGWMMKKIGVRPRLFRSRLLVYIPLILALYMFVWPSFKREVLYPFLQRYAPDLYAGVVPIGPFPPITNHLMTDDFWATFASPIVAVPFFLVCGFATVYFLGAKGFCTYGCPYGGFFFPADRFALGKIVANLDTCEKCGHCTASCTSNVQVHKEIQVHEAVVSPGCMKCLDCVSVCPTGALSYGFTRPSLFKPKPSQKPPRRNYDMTWPEELGIAGVVAFTFYATRGVYAQVPMLFAIGIATCMGFIGWKLWRVLRSRDVHFHRFRLKKGGRVQTAGKVYVGLACLLGLLTIHSGWLNWHLKSAESHASKVARFVSYDTILAGMPVEFYAQKRRDEATIAYENYATSRAFWRGGTGLLSTPGIDLSLARMAIASGNFPRAEEHLRSVLDDSPDDEATYQLARVLVLQRRADEAERLLAKTLEENPDFPTTRRELSKLYVATQRPELATKLYLDHLAKAPEDTLASCRLALEVQVPVGDLDGAFATLRASIALGPDSRERESTLDTSVVSLARALGSNGRLDDARKLIDEAYGQRPESETLLRENALLHLHHREVDQARAAYEEKLVRNSTPQSRLHYAIDVLIPNGDFQAAQTQIDLAFEKGNKTKHPQVDAAYAALGNRLRLQKKPEQATKALEQVLEAHPDFGASRDALAALYLEGSQAEKAIVLYTEYLEESPVNATARAKLANLYLQLNRQREALEELQRATRDDPHNGSIRADLALVYFRKNELPRAIAETRAALELSPHQYSIVGRLSELLELAGERDEAGEWRQRLELLQAIGG